MSDEAPEAEEEFEGSAGDSHESEQGESTEEVDAEETFAARETDPFAGMTSLEDLVSDDLRKVAAERDEYLDALRRLQADFDNFRKRAMRQQTETLERAGEGLMKQLLPVLDALDLALAHEVDESESSSASLAQIGSLLRDTLSREGLERIDGIGVPFDPTIHDAVAHEPADPSGDSDGDPGSDSEAGTPGDVNDVAARAASAPGVANPSVSEVLRAGYRLKGKVVRPAMVKVRG